MSRKTRRRFLKAFVALLVAPFFAAGKVRAGGHHLADGTFANNYIAAISKPASALAKWRRESPGHSPLAFPLYGKRDSAFLRENKNVPTITWIGHATMFLQLDGVNILTDPHFSERASPVSFVGPKRTTPPGFELDELPAIDIVILSHNHYDHLDSRTIRKLARQNPQPLFFAPLRLGDDLRAMGAKEVRELDWHQSAQVGALTLTAVPCQHWSSRLPWDRNKTLWAAWRIQSPQLSALFIGDTGYSRDFADMRARYGKTDMAIIPIGAYEPRWFMKDAHINPDEAVRIFRDIGARFAVASHWGCFQLTDEPMDEPPQKLKLARQQAGLSAADFAVLQPGETRDLRKVLTAIN